MVNQLNLFGGIYQNKRVLITGHTGFKGSWLALWLLGLGAKVAGYSAYLPSSPCNFQVLDLQNKIKHYENDTRDLAALRRAIMEFQPEIIFHLAAQPIVKKSFKEPRLTFESNLMGAVNLLECVKDAPCIKAVVVITSDKSYRNKEWAWGYREDDELGGDDPYSASKACVEIACRSYQFSFFKNNPNLNIATTRAGNVIGGGDWAEDRIVPDCIRSLSRNEIINIRSPRATRPWQHVLEPLSGYLWLGRQLIIEPTRHDGQAYNFGPDNKVIQPVSEMVKEIIKHWGQGNFRQETENLEQKECTLLKLNCDKALNELHWRAILGFEETIKLTVDWYRRFYFGGVNMFDFANSQISHYVDKAAVENLEWTK
ncbi:CDP-glucose 4,6-dehydratase [Candidatus Falkowbacteria bacterium]|nr:CDP-glucose 4,6-dehydratase [Candidatus Falkowbacteria bacterium]